jgi:hypothetical protein
VQVRATPSDFDFTYGLCAVPEQAYGRHGEPVFNEFVTFTFENSEGELVTTWNPGERYTLTTASASLEAMQAFVHTSLGTFALFENADGPATGFIAQACKSAWGSYSAEDRHRMLWTAPEAVPPAGQCAIFSGVQATSQVDAYQTNTVSIPFTLSLQTLTPRV